MDSAAALYCFALRAVRENLFIILIGAPALQIALIFKVTLKSTMSWRALI
jgi:hypothetical protein